MHRQPSPHRSRGTIYIAVLGVSLIIFVIGMAALLNIRIQTRTVALSADSAQARLYARSAVELGMLYINGDPNWRTDYGNGAWFTNQPVANGFMSLTAADPLNNDLTSGANHPVVFTATGRQNLALYMTQVRLEVGPKSGSCLQVAMLSGQKFKVLSTNLKSNQTIATNTKMNIRGGAIINANVAYLDGVDGSGYAKTPVRLRKAQLLPSANAVMNYYVANGTAISYASLPPASNPNLVVNPSFETNTTGWYCGGSHGVLALDNTTFKDGSKSLLVSSRQTAADVACQDLPIGSIKNGNSYQLSLAMLAADALTVQASLVIVASGGTVTVSTPPQSLLAGQWTTLTGTINPTWSGTVSKVTLTITTTNTSTTYNIDALSLQDNTYPSGSYVIDRVLISPSSNPFGAQTNPNGIYVLNCNQQKIAIVNSRIVGTLVLQNAGDGNVVVAGSVTWEPARENYPALISDGSVTIATTATALSEATCGVNFNPAGTPYPYLGGTANNTATDSYPAVINGIVYTAGNFYISNAPSGYTLPAPAPVFNGNVIAAGDLQIDTAPTITVNYSNAAYLNPPPQFNLGTVTIRDVPGTWQRTTN